MALLIISCSSLAFSHQCEFLRTIWSGYRWEPSIGFSQRNRHKQIYSSTYSLILMFLYTTFKWSCITIENCIIYGFTFCLAKSGGGQCGFRMKNYGIQRFRLVGHQWWQRQYCLEECKCLGQFFFKIECFAIKPHTIKKLEKIMQKLTNNSNYEEQLLKLYD